MKHYLLFFFAMLCLVSHARQEQIVLTQNGHQHDREGLPLFFDTPIALHL